MSVSDRMICVYVVRPDASGQSHEFLQLRRAGNPYPGIWTTVYGGREEGETAVLAALRELREETGTIPAEFYRIGIAQTFYIDANDTTYAVPAFCAVIARETPVHINDEHDDLRWIHRSTTSEAFIWYTEKLAIAALCEDILDNSPAKTYLRIQ